MYPSIEKLKEVLLKQSYISPEDSAAAEAAAHDSMGYVEFLIRSEVLSKTLLGQALAESYNLPFANLEANPVSKEDVNTIDEKTAREQRLVYLKSSDKVVAIATDAPESVNAKTVMKIFPKLSIRLAYTLPEYIDRAFEQYEQPLETRFSKILESSQRIAPEIVDEIIKDALSFKASDIHFEPQSDIVTVRFRVDGMLREAGKLPRENYDNVLNRLKVESGMRIDEHLTAQDGAIQRISDNHEVDLRVSLVPTVEGEKIVMRVLGSYVQNFTFADVGLEENHRKVIERSIAKPFGMILTVGPTGSGKTTTLYALLKALNTPNVNITTIEDPVEYKMHGTNQIQVHEATNLTFAKGLRSIVRQDPDVILVGEIRDRETAEISVNAALTGHLLLSTFHSNDAATAMPRLVDMGIEPFLLSSTLDIIIAQRLVRTLCMQCRYSVPVKDAISELHVPTGLNLSKYFMGTDSLYASKGCGACNNTGFKGRLAVFEIIEVTPEMQELMMTSPSTRGIEKLARKQGSQPMFEDGTAKVRRGFTTLAEVLRVVPLPSATGAKNDGS
jgi:type II secretory ATPase GspE/PulE/Tfp pilus assembly ATPase PilB-like protein